MSLSIAGSIPGSPRLIPKDLSGLLRLDLTGGFSPPIGIVPLWMIPSLLGLFDLHLKGNSSPPMGIALLTSDFLGLPGARLTRGSPPSTDTPGSPPSMDISPL